jgi:hypothetical protein
MTTTTTADAMYADLCRATAYPDAVWNWHGYANTWLGRRRAEAAYMPREQGAAHCRAANRAYNRAERIWNAGRAARLAALESA